MVRKSFRRIAFVFPLIAFSGCVALQLAAPAAAQWDPNCAPTACYKPVAVQTYQPVIIQRPRCCLSFLCDWLWGRPQPVAVAPAPVPQTVGYAPYAPYPAYPASPCATCGASPCSCTSASTTWPGGPQGAVVPASAGNRPGQPGGNVIYANYRW